MLLESLVHSFVLFAVLTVVVGLSSVGGQSSFRSPPISPPMASGAASSPA